MVYIDYVCTVNMSEKLWGGLGVRVGPIYEKFSDQALNWSKVVPWHEKQSEAIIFQLS